VSIKVSDYDLFINPDSDEKGANGIWDLAGDVGLLIGLNLKATEILPKDFIVFGNDFGQELIYNVLQDLKIILAGGKQN